MNTRLQDKIDQYHSGRMSSKEISSFEKELASDPSLQAESDFQSDIINGLKEYRRSELKTRLNGVDVSPVWYEFVQQSALLKSFGGVAVATIIGTGVFFLAEPKSEEISEIVIDSPKQVFADLLWEIKPASIVKEIEGVNVFDGSELKTDSQQSNLISEEAKPQKVLTIEEEVEESEAFSPAFNAPAAEEITDEEALEVSSLDELPESPSEKSDTEPIDVDYESTKALDIKYKYYDGKLFLSGDFDRAPYEILEINSADGRRIYVKYLDKFYKVNVTDKLTALPQVYNVNVIKELQLLRQNK